MTLVADFAQLTKPDGECVELFNRERSAAYAHRLGMKEVQIPQDDTIASLCYISYSDPESDGMFWAGDPLASLVTGFIPLSVVGLDGSPVRQLVEETASGRSVIGEELRGSRSLTFQGVISGVSCCAVDRYIRRFSSWLTDCMSCDGMELRLLLCPPEEVETCDGDVVTAPAEWATFCGVALTSTMKRIRSRGTSGRQCSTCGGSRHEVVQFTVTATDPDLYGDEVCVAEQDFSAEDVDCNIGDLVLAVCCPTKFVTFQDDKEAKPVRLLLDGTACPIGWDLADWEPESCYMVPAVIDEPPEQQACKPYRVRLKVDSSGATTWAPVNPDRWPGDGSVPCDCEIVAVDIEYSNPDFQETCPDCPGAARSCAESNGLVIGDDGLIDRAASGFPTPTPAFGVAGFYPAGGPAPGWMTSLFGYLQCLGISTATSDAGEIEADPQAVIDGCASVASITGANVFFDSVVPSVEGQIAIAPTDGSFVAGSALCNAVINDVPGWSTPLPEPGDETSCGQSPGDHCLPTRVSDLGSSDGECFTIELAGDGSWSHPGWDFARDGIPPLHGYIEVKACATDADDPAATCETQTRDCAATIQVTDTGLVWATDGSWEFSELDGVPSWCNVVFPDQTEGEFTNTIEVRDEDCGKCSQPAQSCVDSGCGDVATIPEIPDTSESCELCTIQLASVSRCVMPPTLKRGECGIPRFLICAGSEPLSNFQIRAVSDPVMALIQWDASQVPPVPVVGDNGEHVLIDNAHEFIAGDCQLCVGFGIRHLPAGAVMEIDAKNCTATVYCNDRAENGLSLLYGLTDSGLFNWDDLVFGGCDPVVVCGSADAFNTGLVENAVEPATWSMWWRTRQSG